MAATSIGSSYSPSSTLNDTISPIYPDRPIRPLPKRRLRSRLSLEVANSILYPATPRSSQSLFHLPFNASLSLTATERASVNGDGGSLLADLGQPQANRLKDTKNGYHFKGNDLGSDEEDGIGIIQRYQQQRQATPSLPRTLNNGAGRSEFPKHVKPTVSQSTISSVDSVDGYDSFENTNNKKKRKIPTSGNLGNHQSTLSAEMAHMGISSNREMDVSHADADGGVGQYYGTGNSAIPAGISVTGMSGAGRGRYGRIGARTPSGRSPLAVSINGSNTLQSGRMLLQRRDHTPSARPGGKDPPSGLDQGIISAAIANAAALPATLPKGQENISLLEHQSSRKSTSAKTQFTFTCESDSAKTLAWSGQHNPNSQLPYSLTTSASANNSQAGPSHRGVATQGTQTSPSIAGQTNQAVHQNPSTDQQTSRQGRKPRRPSEKQYSLAARQRRLRQDYNNYHHPPNPDDVWICEFCEYESIFGSPPEALIRQYEIKDRRERRRLAEKRRLLEKAKMKGRKGKKGNKAALKNANAATVPQQSTPKPRYDPQTGERISAQHQGTQSEDYLGDDYDDDPTHVSALPNRSPTKIPQPVAHGHNQSLRSTMGSRATNTVGVAG